jgi:hypothetical protein
MTISSAFSINNAGVGEILHGDCPCIPTRVLDKCCVDGGVARQQQLDDFNMTLSGGNVQRGPFAEGTGNQKQMAEAQHNRTSAEHFQSRMQV